MQFQTGSIAFAMLIEIFLPEKCDAMFFFKWTKKGLNRNGNGSKGKGIRGNGLRGMASALWVMQWRPGRGGKLAAASRR